MHTKTFVRALLSMVVAGVVLLCAITSARAFVPQEEGEEEDFYRASDPEEPSTGEPKRSREQTLFRLAAGTFTVLNEDRGAGAGDPFEVRLEFLWNLMPDDSWFTVDAGFGGGGMFAVQRAKGISNTEFESLIGRYNLGFAPGTTFATGVADAKIEAQYFHGEGRVQVDFFGPQPFDLSASFGLGGGVLASRSVFDVPGAQPRDDKESLTAWHLSLGGEAGYTGNNVAFGVRLELRSMSAFGGDIILLRSTFHYGLYIGYRF